MRELLRKAADDLAEVVSVIRDDVRAIAAAEAMLRAAAEVWPEQDTEQEAAKLLAVLAQARAEGFAEGMANATAPDLADPADEVFDLDKRDWVPAEVPPMDTAEPVAKFDLETAEWTCCPPDDEPPPAAGPVDEVTASDSVSVRQVDAVQLRKGDVRKGD